ncbi:MAG: exodeoxyribonuclease III [Myxococcota bacterium]
MKIATWNVNSIRVREDPVLDWLERYEPDVLCMQETKLSDQEFPEDVFGDIDYDVVYHGQRSYNGVAIASRPELEDVTRGFPDVDDQEERRLISARVEGIRIVDIYLPNGQGYGTDKFGFKLRWMEQLRDWLEDMLRSEADLILCGDFNIAPGDLDHHWEPSPEPRLFTSPEERTRLQAIMDLGLEDAFRHLYPDQRIYTWWDYRGRDWQRDEGMRIDLTLVTPSILQRVRSVEIHRQERSGDNPSDHVPVLLELD